MTDLALERRGADSRLAMASELVLLGLILLLLGLKLHLIFVLNVNWDEFFYLSFVHDYARGSLNTPLQTFHVHLFGWLPLIAENEVDQIIAARAAVYVLGLGSCLFTFLIGRLFLERLGALFAVLCLLALSSVTEHGASFRADPLCAFLLLGATYCLLRRPKSPVGSLTAALGTALSLAITIKSAVFLPMIGAIFLCWIRSGEPARPAFGSIATFAVVLPAGYLALYALHAASLPPAPLTDSTIFVKNVVSKAIAWDHLFPRWRYFVIAFVRDFWIWALLAVGAGLVIAGLRDKADGRRGGPWLPLTFLIPLSSILFYRNAFPYFYVFVISPAIVLCGFWVSRMAADFKAGGSARSLGMVGILTLPVMAGALDHYLDRTSDATVAQREAVQLVHKIFPHPVSYLDRCAMISSYPSAGFFMSTWVLEAYQHRQQPVMRRILEDQQPRFLLANSPVLDLSRSRDDTLAGYRHALLPEDFEALKGNFVHHWGILYVAGKHFVFGSGQQRRDFEILVPGHYTVEAETPVAIDGAVYEAGDLVALSAGRHAIEPTTTPAQVTLRWGNRLFRPSHSPSSQPIFVGFK